MSVHMSFEGQDLVCVSFEERILKRMSIEARCGGQNNAITYSQIYAHNFIAKLYLKDLAAIV